MRILIVFFLATLAHQVAYTQMNSPKLSLHKGFHLLTIDRVLSMKHLNEAISQDSTYAEAYYYRGILEYKIGNYQKAIEDFNAAYDYDDELDITFIYKGFSLRNMGNFNEAVENFSTYLEMNPEDTSAYAYILRGKVRNESGDHMGAISDYNLAIALKPIEEKYYYYRYLSNYKRKLWSKALKEIDKTIAINPDFYGYYFYKANTLFELKNYKTALKVYDKSISLNSYNGDAFFHKGKIYQIINDHQEAIEQFNMALMITEDGTYYSYRGNSKYEMGDKTGACDDWESANHWGYYEDYEKMKKLCD